MRYGRHSIIHFPVFREFFLNFPKAPFVCAWQLVGRSSCNSGTQRPQMPQPRGFLWARVPAKAFYLLEIYGSIFCFCHFPKIFVSKLLFIAGAGADTIMATAGQGGGSDVRSITAEDVERTSAKRPGRGHGKSRLQQHENLKEVLS